MDSVLLIVPRLRDSYLLLNHASFTFSITGNGNRIDYEWSPIQLVIQARREGGAMGASAPPPHMSLGSPLIVNKELYHFKKKVFRFQITER